MLIAYFVTASILCVWLYRQTRLSAKKVRSNRRHLPNPLD